MGERLATNTAAERLATTLVLPALLPLGVGVPEMKPVSGLMLSPGGRPPASYFTEDAAFSTTTWKPVSLGPILRPTFPVALVPPTIPSFPVALVLPRRCGPAGAGCTENRRKAKPSPLSLCALIVYTLS